MPASSPSLTLSPRWGYSESYTPMAKELPLGDGYAVTASVGINAYSNETKIERELTDTEKSNIETQLKLYGGAQIFRWRAMASDPFRDYRCSNWSIAKLSRECDRRWLFTLTLEEVVN